ncbi:MAG: hypothetical protein K940chlam6_01355 [Chlamydiae bacterium]|nr:hypothetical protein [Chlamydiota bacterium]
MRVDDRQNAEVNYFNPIQVMKKHPVITALAVVAISSAGFYWYNYNKYVCDIKLLDRNNEIIENNFPNTEFKYFCQLNCIEKLGSASKMAVVSVKNISTDIFETCSSLIDSFKEEINIEFITN